MTSRNPEVDPKHFDSGTVLDRGEKQVEWSTVTRSPIARNLLTK